jgi:hypothetical protein
VSCLPPGLSGFVLQMTPSSGRGLQRCPGFSSSAHPLLKSRGNHKTRTSLPFPNSSYHRRGSAFGARPSPATNNPIIRPRNGTLGIAGVLISPKVRLSSSIRARPSIRHKSRIRSRDGSANTKRNSVRHPLNVNNSSGQTSTQASTHAAVIKEGDPPSRAAWPNRHQERKIRGQVGYAKHSVVHPQILLPLG